VKPVRPGKPEKPVKNRNPLNQNEMKGRLLASSSAEALAKVDWLQAIGLVPD
jgi:hypothetical protein